MIWQPIETAPTDGTEVLICSPAWLAAGIGAWTPDALPGRALWTSDDGAIYEPPPTHWMPLPAPPEDAK